MVKILFIVMRNGKVNIVKLRKLVLLMNWTLLCHLIFDYWKTDNEGNCVIAERKNN